MYMKDRNRMPEMSALDFFLMLKDEIEDELHNPELREIVKEAAADGKEALLALPCELGYDVTDETGLLSDEELEKVSGGVSVDAVLQEIIEKLAGQNRQRSV